MVVRVKKIVLTGGPCSGKTTAMKSIKKELEGRGYTVLLISETAAELMGGGLTPLTCGTNFDYQKCQISLQLFKEKIYDQGVRSMQRDNILIICDRGILDNKAYMSDAEFENCLKELNVNENFLKNGYDAVFHLVTAAKGVVEAYTLSNLETRTETISEAITIDDKILAAWSGHPYQRIIESRVNFEEKLQQLMEEIIIFLEYEITREL